MVSLDFKSGFNLCRFRRRYFCDMSHIVNTWAGALVMVASLFLARPVQAQQPSDTVRIELPTLEQQFLERNFQLIAQKYQVDILSAAIIQAGLRPNPNVSLQTNFFNPGTSRIFPLGTPSNTDLANNVYNSGEIAASVQQLFLLAGKRSKLVRLAESNRALQSLAFRDLLRSLRYQLYTAYAELYADFQSYTLLQQEEARQERLAESYRVLLSTGGAAPYEVTRLEEALQELRAGIADYQAQLADDQGTLRILLRQDQRTFYLPLTPPIATSNPPSVEIALDSAIVNRPDLGIAAEQIVNANASLSLEKARRVPDLVGGVFYDRYGSAYRDLIGVSVAMDVPVFNRNQGAIKAAELQTELSKVGQQNQLALVRSDVLNAFDRLNGYYRLNTTYPTTYRERLQTIASEATRSYNSRAISLLDYLDKIRTFEQGQLNLINLQKSLYQAQQQVNFVTNTRFF